MMPLDVYGKDDTPLIIYNHKQVNKDSSTQDDLVQIQKPDCEEIKEFFDTIDQTTRVTLSVDIACPGPCLLKKNCHILIL